MGSNATSNELSSGVLEERRSSPGLLLALLGQEAMRRLRDAHTAHNLKPRQFQLIGLLHDHGAMGQRELGEAMGVDPSILVTLLNPLEADGFVSREAEDALFAGLDEVQRQQLSAVLVVLRDSLASGHEGACSPPETTEDG